MHDLILLKNIVMDSEGESHERMATSIVVEVANIGGLTEIAFVLCWGLYLYFGQPFKDLNLAISFSKLMSKVNKSMSY